MHHEFIAPVELSSAIKCLWYDSRDYGNQLTGFEVIPDGYAELIFYFGSGCSVFVNENLEALPSPFMIGLLNHPVTFYAQHRLQIVGIRCYPWAVFEMLGRPAGNNGVQAFAHPIAQLQPQLDAAISSGNVDEAINILTQYFTTLQPQHKPGAMLTKAGTAIRQGNGTLAVSDIAEAAHATVRTLERNFKQSSGHTVKDVSALVRFEHVRNHLWMQPDSSLSALAHTLGYTDQAHLSKEFKRFSGTTPAAFARKAKKDKPFGDSNFVAFIQA